MRKQMRQTAIRISFSCALKNAHRCAFNCSQVCVRLLTGERFIAHRCAFFHSQMLHLVRLCYAIHARGIQKVSGTEKAGMER